MAIFRQLHRSGSPGRLHCNDKHTVNLGLTALRVALAAVSFCAASGWGMAACVPVQHETEGGAVQANVHPLPWVASDFEVKFARGEFLVRRKGTTEWIRSSKLSEPVVVGYMDGDHRVYVGSKALKPPTALHTEFPDYPASESNSGNKVGVSLHMVVDERGAVRFPAVDITPGPEFAKAAIEAVRKWRFEPAKLNGQPVAVLFVVEMAFVPVLNIQRSPR